MGENKETFEQFKASRMSVNDINKKQSKDSKK